MNQIRVTDEERDLRSIREIVSSGNLPDFVRGFDVALGEFDGSPAAWITLRLTGSDDLPLDVMQRRSETLVSLHQALTPALLRATGGRFPFFRSGYGEPAIPVL